MDDSLLSVSVGSNSYGRALFADSFDLGEGHLLAAIEGFQDDGAYDRAEDFKVGRGVLRYTRENEGRHFSLTAMGYDGEWLSSDQIPQRAVDAGTISRFGLIDKGPRGTTQRLSLSAQGLKPRARGADRFSAYVMAYDFSLVGNFTYFLDNPERGDQVLQRDDRLVTGAELSRSWLTRVWDRQVELTTGVQMRYDDLRNRLDRTELDDKDTIRSFESVLRADVELFTGGPFVEARMRFNDWFRLSGGLRLDGYYADVASDRRVNSGSVDDLLVSPKLSLAFGPWQKTELYVNYGRGFHSNDAKGAVITIDPNTGQSAERAEPLVETEGFDVGVRTTAISGLQSTVTLFSLELGSELIFVGDAGVTEAGRPSRRLGIEWTNHYQLNRVLWIDLDATWTDAEFRDNDPAGNQIPGSVGRTIAAGLSFSNDGPWSASMRWRYFGDIPLVEDGSRVWSSSSTLNGQVGYRFRNGLVLSLQGFNLTDRKDNDVEYFYASRLPGEPAGGVEDIHFHPLPERSFRLSLTWRR
jgi:outer membrane receptor protein involved in Fe transport